MSCQIVVYVDADGPMVDLYHFVGIISLGSLEVRGDQAVEVNLVDHMRLEGRSCVSCVACRMIFSDAACPASGGLWIRFFWDSLQAERKARKSLILF